MGTRAFDGPLIPVLEIDGGKDIGALRDTLLFRTFSDVALLMGKGRNLRPCHCHLRHWRRACSERGSNRRADTSLATEREPRSLPIERIS